MIISKLIKLENHSIFFEAMNLDSFVQNFKKKSRKMHID